MDTLEQLEERFPGTRSKVLIDLMNGINVSKDLIEYRKKPGFFGNLIDKLAGNNKERQELINGNLVVGQDALYQWVLDLSKDHSFSHVALQITQQKLLDTQKALVSTSIEVGELRETLNRLVEFVKKQIHAEFKAHEKLDDIVTAWEAGRTYTSLPWAVQVALLAQELFSSDVIYQLKEDERKQYIPRLINKILANSQQLPESFFALSNLLELSLADLSSEDRAVANWLLEIDPLLDNRFINKPHLFVIGKTLKFAMLQQRQVNPVQEAIAICRKFAFISSATDKWEFVKAVVQETADDCLAIIKGKQADFAVTLDSHSSDALSGSPLVPSRQPLDTPSQLPLPSLPELLQQEHPKFGLVLAGGGAKGAYQVGVLKYLSEELNFVPHMIAGTSIGALNGAFLASHQPFDEAVKKLEEIWAKISNKIRPYKLDFELAKGLSIFDPEPIEKLLRGNVKLEALRDGIELYVTVFPSFNLAIPLLDYLRGFFDSLSTENCTKAEWHSVSNSKFNDDTLYNLILASAAIPVAFPRRNINGQPYVDGFLGDNIPLGALEKKCDFAIVIHLDNGETWSRHKFPAQTIIEIRPQLRINESWNSALNFDPDRIQELKKRGEEDARRYIEPIITTLIAEYWRTRTLRSLVSSTKSLVSSTKKASFGQDSIDFSRLLSKASSEMKAEIETKVVALFGKPDVGKSAIVNSLRSAEVVKTSITYGKSPWSLVDMPGIIIGNKLNEELLIAEAQKAHGHIFVIDGEPYRDEIEFFNLIHKVTPDTPKIVFVNKWDIAQLTKTKKDREIICSLILEKMRKFVKTPADIVYGSAMVYHQERNEMIPQELPQLLEQMEVFRRF